MLRRGNKKRDGHAESSSNANNDDGAARASVYPSSGSNGSNLNLSSAALAGGSGGPSRPLTIRTTSQSTSQSIEASTRAMQHQHSHHPHSGPFTSRHIPSSSSVDALSPFGSSPGSTAPTYYHHPQQQQHHQQPQQQQQQQQPPQQVQQTQTQQQSSSGSMGRSQSAFNFILAKAKAPFSSSSSQQQIAMHPSPSMSSMVNSQGIPEDGGNLDAGRSRYTSNPSTQPSAPAMERRGTNEQQAAPSWASMRPSMGDDQAMPISSPTKRSFFGAHRERKASTTSLTRSMAASPVPLAGAGARAGAGAGAGATPSQPSSSPSMPMSMSVYDRDRDRDRERSRGALSPLSKASSSYGQFSKSQSDLHMRSSDFPSPGHSVVDLPKVPSLRGAMQAVHQDDASLLRSPSPQYGFSRSVDDLAQSVNTSSSTATTSGKAGAMSPPLRPAHQNTMGEHGVAAHDWGRPSDVGTLASSRQQQQQQQVPFSSAGTPKQQSASSPSPSQQQQHHHQRKASKQIKDDREAYLQQTSRGQLPGITYEGLLNRNANISLPLAQLVADGAGGAKGREKDITKGWKPYKVQLREGKLYFYKPPSAFSDDMKQLFPVHVVRGGGSNAAAAYAREIGLDPEAIKRGKLGTQDLLAATSGKQSTSSAGAATSAPAWAFPAKHPDLVLVDAVEKPATWAARVQGGSHDALAHEYVFATQSDPDEEGDGWKEEAGTMVYALLTALSRSARPMHGFLVAIQKWTLMALSDKDEGTAASEPVQKRERIRARIQLLVESDLVEFGQLHERASLESVLEGIVGDAWRDDRRMAADILATLKESQPAEPPHDWLSRRERPTRSELTALVNAGLGPSTLLRTDPAEVARQIHAFHIDHLASLQLPSASTVRLLAKSPSTTRSHRLLCFDSSAPHLLTSLVLDQVLFSSGSASPADSRSEQQAGSRQRATLLRHWIAVASGLLKMHDVAGWAAICAALCSRAVTRLSMTWRFVAKEDRAIVGDYWARQLADLGWSELAISPDGTKREPVEAFISSPATIKYAMAAISASAGPEAPTVPFLGNSIVQARAYPPLASSASFLPLVETREVGARLWTLNKAWQLGAHNRMNPSVLQQQHGIAPSPDIQRALQSLLELHQSVTDSDMAYRNLSRSLAIEPRIDVPKRNKRPLQLSKKTATLALSPLLFVDSLPNLSLVDRQEMAVYAEEANGNGGTKKADEQGTITEKNAKTRSPLMSLPPAMMRRASKAFSPGMLSRPLKGVSFAGITEFNTGEGGSEESLIRMGSDIVFAITSEPSVSLPSSPMTSKRFSTELNRAARPISQVSSKRSSLPASNRSSMVEPPTPVQVHVVVKAASLDRLVDILVMGVQHLSVNTSEDSAERPSGRKSRLVMDLPLFRTTFLSTFRLFCPPVLLLDLLRKRFVAAINASREMALPEQHRSGNPFPTWSLVETVGTHVEPIDWDTVSRIRSGVTSVLTAWIARFPHDFAEDHELYIGVHSLTQDMDTLLPRHPEDSEYEKMASTLESLVRQLRANVMGTCARQGDRVTASRRTSQPVLSGATPPASTVSPSQKQLGTSSVTATTIDFDTITPAELVDYLESVASIFVDKIEERDLLAISELFENQASDALGWYVDSQHSQQQQQQPSSQDDSQPLCTNMYKLIELLRYGGAGSGSSLHMCLPMAVRDACAAQNLLRGWVAINIIEMRIGLARRQARLEKLLDAVWICRARMANTRVEEQSSTPLSPSFPFKEATIASFVESAIVGSLGSPESRYHLRAWQGVAAARKAAGDKLADLFPPQSTWDSIKDSATTTTGALCALDIGWLLECLAQASTRSSEAAPHPLVDFEKYRTIYTLIDASLQFKSQMSAVATVAPEVANARLTEMQRALRSVAWDRRAFKEEANQEAATAPPLPANAKARAMYRPLTGLLGQQQDKQQRDRRAYEVLVKQLQQQQQQQQQGQQQQQQQQFQTATSPSLQAPSSSSPSSSASSSSGLRVPGMDASSMGNKGGEKKTRRMTALFRGAVRPMGGLMSFDRPSASVGDSTDAGVSTSRAGVAPMEMLQLTPTQKPALVIPCGAARVSVWQNSQRSYCFHLSSMQNGQHVLLQAPSQADVSEWFSQIERAAKEYAGELLSKPMDKRSAEKAEKAAAAAAAAAAASASGKGRPTVPLYGTDIKVLVEHERREVPLGLVRMLQEVEARGLQEQGIYRISGAKSAIEHLKVAFGQQPAESIDLARGEFSDVHTIAGAIKQWFRDLPEPPIPFKYYNAIIEAEKMESEEDRLYAIRDMIWEFPKPHFDLLRRISEHLARVVEEGKSNLMAPHNIGLVFGTSLLNPPPGPASVAQSFGNIGSAAHIVKIIVTMHDWLFEPEPEPEAEPEVEPEREAGQGQEPESQGISVDEAEIGGRDDDDANVGADADANLVQTAELGNEQREAQDQEQEQGQEQAHDVAVRGEVPAPREDAQQDAAEGVDGSDAEREGGSIALPRSSRSGAETLPLLTPAGTTTLSAATNDAGSSSSSPGKPTTSESDISQYHNLSSGEAPSEDDSMVTTPGVGAGAGVHEGKKLEKGGKEEEDPETIRPAVPRLGGAQNRLHPSSSSGAGGAGLLSRPKEESIYLDAQDAIAVLNPFEDE